MSKKVNSAELTILKALWSSKQLSAREVHDDCVAELRWSFSSTRTTLQRMIDKGLLEADKAHGLTIYRAKIAKVVTLAAMMKDFMHGVLELDAPLPTSAFHDSRLFSEDELAELDLLLKEGEE